MHTEKSGEKQKYASLLGGNYFELDESKPMLGFRGASSYYDERYREGFSLECKAMKIVRDKMGLTNLILMIPFCRRIEEAEKVLAEMKKNGLERGNNGLQVYVMCEIPTSAGAVKGNRWKDTNYAPRPPLKAHIIGIM